MHGKSLAALAATAASLCFGCSPHAGSNPPAGSGSAPGGGPTVTIFALAELRGQIEPCGCTTDPLGDLARTVALVDQARSHGPVVVVDAGSSLFDLIKVPPHRADQEKLKADLIVKTYTQRLKIDAWGVGPSDVGMGLEAVRPARQAVNAKGFAIEPPKVIGQVGVFGVLLPNAIEGLEVGDPIAASKAAIADLKKKGAQVIVALVQAPSKREAAAFVRDAGGIDVAVAGLGALAPEPDKMNPRAEKVGDAWLVVPANRGQVVARIELTLRPGAAPLVDAVGPDAAVAEETRLDTEIKSLEDTISGFEKDPSADKAFVAQKKQELVELRAQRHALETQPLQAPPTGSYFTLAMVRISKKLACDKEVQDAKATYSRDAGAANVKAAASRPPIAVAAGKPTYVGIDECANCHAAQVEFWQKTPHAHAFATLEASGKQLDYECTSCHVTGWDEPGGSTMASNEALRNVQCEVCHGPGSIHAEKEGKDVPSTIARRPAPDLCANKCHTPQHSDTFQMEAYLRDILGPGHGEKARKALGDGPTGHELRAAGLAKAGKEIGPGCSK
ncbi:MAG TPA: multiheme c-type cytochrome [Kofleriaceae bacterium]|nr:multiheme c-type cytochrome [Kofleriaceae bacterium]